ncbi:MAG: zinc ribbon domain-containing protein [Armatimonadota bacterium]|nr:zinc ribbon domain-containing protein [Armatimonadota bacterium]MDR5702439.1 zinc ribbon domain-containing protein [Armatimonadota bacterium]
MRCPKCGTENPPGKIVCRKCGVRLRPQATSQESVIGEEVVVRWVRRDLGQLAVVLVILITCGALLGFLFR